MKLLKTFLTLSIVSSASFASQEILTPVKQQIFDNSYKKATEDSSKLKKDWISPITYQFIYNDDGTYKIKKSFIGITQPIFKSGGIYSAIKYANNIKKYSKTSIDIQKKELIKTALELVLQLRKLDISIKQQKLLIQNSKLDIKRKREQVLNGILDTSFLDSAILDANQKQNILIDLQLKKTILQNNLAKISNITYDKFDMPTLKLLNEEEFLKNNIYLKQANQEIISQYWQHKMVTSQYLATVNLIANYTKYHDTDNNPMLRDDSVTNIGFNITIPLDIKYSNTTQSSKIQYLEKKLSLQDKQNQQLNEFKTILAKISSLDKKKQIALNDIKLYDSLLKQMVELLSVGMKTQDDVQTMQNSKKIKELELKSIDIDKQIELLQLYSKVENGNF